MSIARWIGWIFVVVSLLGALYGLAAYTFAGYPFGGAAGIAEARAEAIRIILVSLPLLMVWLGLIIFYKRRRSMSDQQEEPKTVPTG